MMADVVKETVTVESRDKMVSEKKAAILLWDVAAATEMLTGITLAAVNNQANDQQSHGAAAPSTRPPPVPDLQDLRVSDRTTCSMCGVEFSDTDEQRDHFKSDWHRCNLKQKLKGGATITEDQFEEMTDAGDVSSISGSDTDEGDDDGAGVTAPQVTSDPQADLSGDPGDDPWDTAHIEGIGRRHPRVFFRNHDNELLSIYRCVLHGKKAVPETQTELLSLAECLPRQMTWAIFMVAAGHFAGAVFQGNTVLCHKTYHRYTVRAKRGTAQSTHDKKGGHARSGGASIRRHCEAALVQEVQDLLTSWADHIKACSRIFLRVPIGNQTIFFGTKTPPLQKKDLRIRMIPFQTRRPTFKELHRVHERLATVECYGIESAITDHIHLSPKKTVPVPATNSPAHSPASGKKAIRAQELRAAEKTDSNASSNEDGDVDLICEDHIIDTSDLQPYEVTRKPRRRKKKEKSDAKLENTATPPPERECKEAYIDPHLVELRNELYTACKTGDCTLLKNCLTNLHRHLAVMPSDDNTPGTTGPTDSDVHSSTDTTRHTDTQGLLHSQRICLTEVLTSKENVTEISQTDTNNSNNVTDDSLTEQMSNIAHEPISDGVTLTENSNGPMAGHDRVLCVLNEPIGQQGTLLHVSGREGHRHIVAMLLEAGSDPTIRDGTGSYPYVVTNGKDARNEYRKYRGRHPHLYDYDRAQIAAAITEDMESEKKAKDADRKKAQRKARKDRLKDQKQEERQQKDEERERQRFLTLSDREKRALAAEKRLTGQLQSSGQAVPVLSRCYQCADDITNQIPFEYMDYKFCTTKCLKEHRQNAAKQQKS